jgi:glutamate--cysteine ligase catalytic subunit
MGLLSKGTPLEWTETKQHTNLVHTQGIQEFLKIYQSFKTNRADAFKWGDEIEFTLIKFDHENKRAQLLLKAEQLLNEFADEKDKLADSNVTFHPEYASYMIESTPSEPFNQNLAQAFDGQLEENMKMRRRLVEQKLDQDEHILSLTSFPRLGCERFTYPDQKPTPNDVNSVTRSLFYPDQAIFTGHPRFSTLSKNIRKRRKNTKVAIYLPVYRDKKTEWPFREDLVKLGGACSQSGMSEF